MTLLDRLSRLIRANLSDLLRRAEDPEKIINQALEDMKEALREAREQVAAAMAEGKRLEREVESHLQEATLWEEKAKEALKAGREDLAKEALRRRKRALDLAEGFKQQAEEQKALIERLMTQLKALEAKIDEAEARKKLLLARKKGVEAAEAVRRMESKLDAHPALEAFEEMEARILSMEDRHEALKELDGQDLEKELAALSAEKELEEELSRLKKELGQS
ncbi:phage shock protein A [Thermus scotoductus]|jgi:phage shock protein A|uniref:Phage shock protein A n=2 Tax=Bacteria TaxID=2 RepID=A0A348XNG8_THESC|nr:PspA/IM30 family protein [Thermus scotoductus]RTG95706.1 phage shock protein A [Thermus scotoductus]RTH03230.1 phage shock protein A [Thermus scotoductus]RTH08948.1 phage shock protein A [Thermus scotoductus]RTH10923.1 phage shock protein A [Thermus scotoductus]RTH12423.1 phage shock protein A [Thermus scotoductus]